GANGLRRVEQSDRGVGRRPCEGRDARHQHVERVIRVRFVRPVQAECRHVEYVTRGGGEPDRVTHDVDVLDHRDDVHARNAGDAVRRGADLSKAETYGGDESRTVHGRDRSNRGGPGERRLNGERVAVTVDGLRRKRERRSQIDVLVARRDVDGRDALLHDEQRRVLRAARLRRDDVCGTIRYRGDDAGRGVDGGYGRIPAEERVASRDDVVQRVLRGGDDREDVTDRRQGVELRRRRRDRC